MNLTDITTIKSLLETANTGFKKSLGAEFSDKSRRAEKNSRLS